MSNLQHDRITTLATELRLLAVPDLYGSIAQTAGHARTPATRISWKTSCAPSATHAMSDRAR